MFLRLVNWIGNPSAMPCMYIIVDSRMGLPASRRIMHAYSAFHEIANIVKEPESGRRLLLQRNKILGAL